MKNKQIDDLPILIENIAPLNNKYRDLIGSSSDGAKVLEVMWKVGKILEDYLHSNNIKPHNLYWQIYGKAEGLKRSYITRDFLSYCLRIKKYFKNKRDIGITYPNLQLYSLFREAFPLLENSNFQLPATDQKELIKLLNSNSNPHQIKARIIEIKKAHIGITNTRKQKLNEMTIFTNSFVKFYNNIYSLIKNNRLNEIQEIRNKTSKKHLQDISQLISALTQEDLFVPEIKLSSNIPAYWQDFILKISELFSSNIETRNRFRRLVAPKKIMQLSDMILSLSDDRSLDTFKKKNNLT